MLGAHTYTTSYMHADVMMQQTKYSTYIYISRFGAACLYGTRSDQWFVIVTQCSSKLYLLNESTSVNPWHELLHAAICTIALYKCYAAILLHCASTSGTHLVP